MLCSQRGPRVKLSICLREVEVEPQKVVAERQRFDYGVSARIGLSEVTFQGKLPHSTEC